MSEKSAVNTLREAFKKTFPRGHWQRIEDAFSVGVPDINVCVPGIGDVWIEAKNVVDIPKRPTTPVRPGLRPEQVVWLLTGKRAGRFVCVCIRFPHCWGWYTRDFQKLDSMTWDELCEAADVMTVKLDLKHTMEALATRFNEVPL